MLLPSSILLILAAAEHPLAPADSVIPLAPAWITGFLLLTLWLTVAAILLGPLVRHFKLEPRSPQFFTGDQANTAPRRH